VDFVFEVFKCRLCTFYRFEVLQYIFRADTVFIRSAMAKLIKMGIMKSYPTLHRVPSNHNLRGNLKTTSQTHTSDVMLPKRDRIKHLLRLWGKSPWEDFQEIRISDGLAIVLRRGSYFQMHTIRSIVYQGDFGDVGYFADITHPNIASIHDLYFFDEKLHLVGEYLQLSLDELNFHYFQLEEWEIATIMTSVRKHYAISAM
jgi:hypothetical protein